MEPKLPGNVRLHRGDQMKLRCEDCARNGIPDIASWDTNALPIFMLVGWAERHIDEKHTSNPKES